MTDISDQATIREEQERDINIGLARKQSRQLPYIGVCYYCDARLPEGHRFCDADCRDGYEHEQEAMRRNRGRA